MSPSWRKIQNTYLLLLLFHTIAASLIWGINTLFLLDAGLTNAETFAANAFFTAGFVLFEVPTGVVADTWGRRTSYLLGSFTLTVSTVLYLLMWNISAPFWAWALASLLLGLGFTFFSGAFQAWLVDALKFTGFFARGGQLESVLAKGEIVEGAAMLVGSVAGGAIAQATHLGVPYVMRSVMLILSFIIAFVLMRDLGFTPRRNTTAFSGVTGVIRDSIQHGLGNPPVRWLMLAAPFSEGVGIYAFYAAQPHLLELYGNRNAYSIAGLAAAVVAGAQIAGGLLVPYVRTFFRKRTSVLLLGNFVSIGMLAMIGLVHTFWAGIALLTVWALVFATLAPIRLAYLNSMIESESRATVLSLDSLLGSTGAVVAQPMLGRSADLWGYPASYLGSAAFQSLAIPFIWFARREHASADEFVPPISRSKNLARV